MHFLSVKGNSASWACSHLNARFALPSLTHAQTCIHITYFFSSLFQSQQEDEDWKEKDKEVPQYNDEIYIYIHKIQNG